MKILQRDHTQRATWLGDRLPLDMSLFKRMREARMKLENVNVGQVAEGDV